MNKNSILKILTTATLLLTLALPSVKASAATNFNRLAGNNRYETSKAISSQFSSGNTAIVVTGENYPDALSAAPLAKKYDAPIILTNSKSLNSNAESELKRLKTKEVYIVGGKAAISENVEKKIKSLGITVKRISGDNRYATSVEVAKKVGLSNGIFVATGENYADALSVGPIAGAYGMPIVLVNKNQMNPSVQKLINENIISETIIVGGENAVSNNVEKKFSNTFRISGNDRYETNEYLNYTFAYNLDFSNLYVATGTNFPDALAGGALAAKNNNPIILTSKNPIQSTIDSIRYNTSYTLTILGGEAVISNDIAYNLSTYLLPEFKLSDFDNKISTKAKQLGFEEIDNALVCDLEVYTTLEDIRSKDAGLIDITMFGLFNSQNQTIYKELLESIFPGKSSIIIDKLNKVNIDNELIEVLNINGREIMVASGYYEDFDDNVMFISISK